jgi:gamma-glutamyltranspeptidase/glutathione hydrolase
MHLPPAPVTAGVAAHALWSGGRRSVPAAARPDAGPGGDEAAVVAVDRLGGAVACTFSMNGPFGAGRIIPGTGLFAANPPGTGADGRATRTPVIVANDHSGDVVLAAAASGGADAPAALIRVARRLLDDDQTVRQALGAEPAGAQVRVDVAYCRRGIRQRPDYCAASADPRGNGLAAVSGF